MNNIVINESNIQNHVKDVNDFHWWVSRFVSTRDFYKLDIVDKVLLVLKYKRRNTK